jgi:hypothetical protein
MEAPGDDDGGLVVVTSESMRCLSCPHSAACRHLHAAGRATGQDTHRRHHDVEDMADYQTLVHAAISPDGQHMKLKGKSSQKIAWSAVRSAWGVGSIWGAPTRPTHSHNTADACTIEQAIDEDLDVTDLGDPTRELDPPPQQERTPSPDTHPNVTSPEDPASAAIARRFRYDHPQAPLPICPAVQVC